MRSAPPELSAPESNWQAFGGALAFLKAERGRLRLAITDRKSAQAWLETQPHEVQIAFGVRATLRGLPELSRSTDKLDKIALPTLRAVFTAAVVVADASGEVQEAAGSSANEISDLGRLKFHEVYIANASHSIASAASSLGSENVIEALEYIHQTLYSNLFFSGPPSHGNEDPFDAGNQRQTNASAAAYGTARLDAQFLDPPSGRVPDPPLIFKEPLWPTEAQGDIPAGEPEGLAQAHGKLVAFFDSDPETWGYWKRWLEGMRNGQPMDWDLQKAVALIDNEVWEAGPKAVAEIIREIEARFEPDPPIDQVQAITQAQVLLRSPAMARNAADGLSALIDTAVTAYYREVSNALPEALEPLEKLPPLLKQIASTLSKENPMTGREAQLADLIQKMAQTISVLNRRLMQAEQRLATEQYKKNSRRRLFADAFYTKSGEGFAELITSKALWGSVIASVGFLLGSDANALVDTLAQCYENIIVPEAPESPKPNAIGLLPPTTYT